MDMGFAQRIGDTEIEAASTTARNGAVVTYWGERQMPAEGHERCTLDAVARALAAIKGYRFAGAYDPNERRQEHLYFVPRDTLLAEDIRELPIAGEDDLFGGVVRHPFVATKTITHALLDARSRSPEGWSTRFPERVREDVLFGYSAFSPEDARLAGQRMLNSGPTRLKLAAGIGGCGQKVVHDTASLDSALNGFDRSGISRDGIVVEQDLTDVTTYSVGQVNAAGLRIAYYGTQRLTANHEGRQVYGGSDLLIVRGDFDQLLEHNDNPLVSLAIEQAMRYDAAARDEFAGFFASRRNYDVAQGFDARGHLRSGVLEQSWRSGGATPAELPALSAFLADATLRAVCASSVEVYGDDDPPPGATVIFRGTDPKVGKLLKYSLMQPYGILP